MKNKHLLEGAESFLVPEKFASFAALKKVRPKKPYRPSALDLQIRLSRTRIEARLMHKAKLAGIPCPHVFAIGRDYILMQKLCGKTLNRIDGKKIPLSVWKKSGQYLARLHGAKITHGDFTPANLMLAPGSKKLFVIDFGLGFVTCDIEDFAVDVLTMKNSLGKKEGAAFLSAYAKFGDKRVLQKMKEVESRARYCVRQGASG